MRITMLVTLTHDWHRPELDSWYGHLRNPQSSSPVVRDLGCCSRTDCHTTEAELRGEDWWARLGTPRRDGDWDLLDWVKVPKEAVLAHQENPAGEAVICHSPKWTGEKPDVAAISIYCFVPPMQS
jgi:hypothetical protein